DPELLPGPAVVEAVSEPDPLPLTAPCPPEPGPPVAGFMLFVSPTDPEHPAESKAARSKPVDPVRVAMSFIVSPASLRGPKSPCDSCNLAGFQNSVLALHVFLSGEDRYPMVDLFQRSWQASCLVTSRGAARAFVIDARSSSPNFSVSEARIGWSRPRGVRHRNFRRAAREEFASFALTFHGSGTARACDGRCRRC